MEDMNHKERHDFYREKNLVTLRDTDKVCRLVDGLLHHLYKPCTDKRTKDGHTFVADMHKVKKYWLEEDAINWGDLSCTDVIKDRDSGLYLVTIEECSPNGCENLKEYIEDHMAKWGWCVNVKTEW